MKITLRLFVTLSAAASTGAPVCQAVGKPNSFRADLRLHFVDVALLPNLPAVIYDNSDSKDYILEAMGCGCAFWPEEAIPRMAM